jgi:hypothetical protein
MPFHPSIMFSNKAGGYPSEAPFSCSYFTTMYAPGAQGYKTFLSIIYEFLYKARVFIRVGWRRFPRTHSSLLRKLANYGKNVL